MKSNITCFDNETPFDQVFELRSNAKHIRYLGDHIGSSRYAVSMRISKASQAYGRLLRNCFRRNILSLHTKLRVFDACVVSILTYGLKCHEATRVILGRLDYFCLCKIKSIFGYAYDDEISYDRMLTEIREHLPNWKWPMFRVQQQRLKFFLDCLKKKRSVC